MSEEIKQHIKRLIFLNRREEAIKALQDEYGLSEDQANEFFDRFRESNLKSFDFTKITNGFAQGCGCFSLLFLIGFVISMYTGIKEIYDEDSIEAEVIGFVEYQEYDSYDSSYYSYYDPIVVYELDEVRVTDTLSVYSPFQDYETGEKLKLDRDTGEIISYGSFDEFSVLEDSIGYLIIAIFAFVGYRVLKKITLKGPFGAGASQKNGNVNQDTS